MGVERVDSETPEEVPDTEVPDSVADTMDAPDVYPGGDTLESLVEPLSLAQKLSLGILGLIGIIVIVVIAMVLNPAWGLPIEPTDLVIGVNDLFQVDGTEAIEVRFSTQDSFMSKRPSDDLDIEVLYDGSVVHTTTGKLDIGEGSAVIEHRDFYAGNSDDDRKYSVRVRYPKFELEAEAEVPGNIQRTAEYMQFEAYANYAPASSINGSAETYDLYMKFILKVNILDVDPLDTEGTYTVWVDTPDGINHSFSGEVDGRQLAFNGDTYPTVRYAGNYGIYLDFDDFYTTHGTYSLSIKFTHDDDWGGTSLVDSYSVIYLPPPSD